MCTCYQEAVEAYKKQNQFLSAELLEMNQLRSDDLSVNKQLVQYANTKIHANYVMSYWGIS